MTAGAHAAKDPPSGPIEPSIRLFHATVSRSRVDVDCSKRPHVFCSHPHGLVLRGRLPERHLLPLKERRRDQRATGRLALRALAPASAFPVVKDWLRSLGFLPATRATARELLEHGETCAIVPGGVREVVWAGRSTREHLYLSDVYGFVAVAIKTGAPLVPVYTFGESLSTGTRLPPGVRHQASALVSPRGARAYSPVPTRLVRVSERKTRHGGRKSVRRRTRVRKPEQERVGETHARYCDALLRLIEETKEEAGYGTQVTEIV